jgi:hypothetical protein
MRNVNRAGWILVGAVIGGLAATALPSIAASHNEPLRRLTVMRTTGATDGSAYFIKDTKTGRLLVVDTIAR